MHPLVGDVDPFCSIIMGLTTAQHLIMNIYWGDNLQNRCNNNNSAHRFMEHMLQLSQNRKPVQWKTIKPQETDKTCLKVVVKNNWIRSVWLKQVSDVVVDNFISTKYYWRSIQM